MAKLQIGDRVRAACERHSDCKRLNGKVIATRDDSFYTHQVKWEQKEAPGWYSELGLEAY
jgi:hypothetical protein